MNATTKWTVNAIQAAMRSRGSHWWDPDTMRMFGTKPVGPVYQGPGGVFFVTRDGASFNWRETGNTGYTVRRFNADEADIDTIGEIAGHKHSHDAKAEAARLAFGDSTDPITIADEAFKPVSVVDQFAHDLQKHTNPNRGTETTTVKAAKELMRLARRHHRMAEQQCNGEGPFADWDGESDSPFEPLRERIGAIAKKAGCAGVIFSGDPRGCTVKLTFTDGYTNDFGHEGYCVPTEER